MIWDLLTSLAVVAVYPIVSLGSFNKPGVLFGKDPIVESLVFHFALLKSIILAWL